MGLLDMPPDLTPPHSLSKEYDQLQADAYTDHLAAVNESCNVVANEDIYNARGVLIVRKGTPITPQITRSIIQFKLVKPIEDSVSIKKELGAEQLESDFSRVMHQDNVLQAIHEHHDLTQLLRSHCQLYDKFPILRQKITVMAERMPETYERTLYCTWLALLIAKEMRLTAKDISCVFLAALAHDIGMLHIDPNILNRKTSLSPEDWRQIQAHVVIAQKILQSIQGIPQSVFQAVLEHHERCDGTGYPVGKVESELGLIGQIVGFSDSVIAIYHNRFKEEGRTWRDVIPVLQMNAQAYLYRNYEVFVTILRRSELPAKNVIQGDKMPEFVADMLSANERLHCWFSALHDCLLTIGFTHGDRRLHSLQNVMLHVTTAVNGSGIFHEQHIQWLRGLPPSMNKNIFREIEDAHLMQVEIIFHLQRLSRMLRIYIDAGECSKPDMAAVLQEGISKAESFAF
jgi:HD-GYP domain-containing protein (c-di-GMP phosphodiesterase class II)